MGRYLCHAITICVLQLDRRLRHCVICLANGATVLICTARRNHPHRYAHQAAENTQNSNATLGVLAPGRTVSRYIGLPGLMSRTMHQAKAEPRTRIKRLHALSSATSDTGLLCTHLQLTTYLQDFQYSSNLTEEHHSHANLPCADSRPWSFCLVVCRVLGKRVYRSKRVTGPMLRIG